jgi:hypothetical protein
MPDPVCPANAEEVVAFTTLAVVGFFAPLAASWTLEMAYRAHFAAYQPTDRARGPRALQWPLPLRLAIAETAFLTASFCAVSAIFVASDAGIF